MFGRLFGLPVLGVAAAPVQLVPLYGVVIVIVPVGMPASMSCVSVQFGVELASLEQAPCGLLSTLTVTTEDVDAALAVGSVGVNTAVMLWFPTVVKA